MRLLDTVWQNIEELLLNSNANGCQICTPPLLILQHRLHSCRVCLEHKPLVSIWRPCSPLRRSWQSVGIWVKAADEARPVRLHHGHNRRVRGGIASRRVAVGVLGSPDGADFNCVGDTVAGCCVGLIDNVPAVVPVAGDAVVRVDV